MNLKDWNSTLNFFVNGKKFSLDKVPFSEYPNLLSYLRSPGVGLVGSKLGCGEGGCGACTVMVSYFSSSDNKIIHRSVNACLFPLCAVDGLSITTVEGVGSTYSQLNLVQKRLSEFHGSQCGFCTPGFIMSIYTFLRNNPKATVHEIESCLDGNLCRCTGYRPILDAAKSIVGEGCCKGSCENCPCKSSSNNENGESQTTEGLGNKELIFPPSLMNYEPKPLFFENNSIKWFRPVTLDQLYCLLKEYPQAKLVVGNTEIGIETRFRNQKYQVFISTTHVPELNKIEVLDDYGIRVGASVTLSSLQQFLTTHLESIPKWKGRVFMEVIEQLRWFAGPQIRNVACLAGNIANASPISDLNPIFLSTNCRIKLGSHNGERTVNMLRVHDIDNPSNHPTTFFVGYKKTVIKSSEAIVNIDIPYTSKYELVKSYTQSRRKEDDIAIVNACFRLLLDPPPPPSSPEEAKQQHDQDLSLENLLDSCVVKEAVFAFGGMAITTKLANETTEFLIGKKWNDSTLEQVYSLMEKDLPLQEGAPGGMIKYRRSLTTSFLFKFYLYTKLEVPLVFFGQQQQQNGYIDKLNETLVKKFGREWSVVHEEPRPPIQGKQDFLFEPIGYVRQPIEHASAKHQVTGQAQYIDDIIGPPNTLMAVYVQARVIPNSKLLKVDPQPAFDYDSSIKGFVSNDDLPKGFRWGTIDVDEPLFVDQYVQFYGEPVGVLLGTNFTKLLEARFLVKMEFQEPDQSLPLGSVGGPPILTLKQAIEAKSYLDDPIINTSGNLEDAFKNADHIVEGTIDIGGQEHFYLEPHSAFAIPSTEHNEMMVWSSTQSPNFTQRVIADVLKVPINRVVVKAKRLGGGFGGKETRATSVAAIAAVSARKYSTPVKLILERDVDMSTSGGRNPYHVHYKIAVNSTGIIGGFQAEFYGNGGCSLDLTHAVGGRVFWNADSSYYISNNFKISVYSCKTNQPSNTAFRGFGTPQAALAAEVWISHVAETVKRPLHEVQQINFLKPNQSIASGELIENNLIEDVYLSLKESCEYEKRLKEVKEWNSKNKYKKRGLAIMPHRYGLGFPVRFLNQATSLVICYGDGSVLITHGGIEMGQGLHTKLLQIAATVLEIPLENVHISETSTDKIPNASPTAASVQSDLNGEAVLNACETLNKRLKPIREKLPKTATFAEICSTAIEDQISLTATGYVKHQDISWSWKTLSGNAHRYFTFGSSATEVEIDCLTGDHWIVRADILIDVGQSLNPTIDIGQVEGAYIQGIGYCTLEELVWSEKDGRLMTVGPGMYKIPTASNIPHDFRVSLYRNSFNSKCIYSGKGIGEPPFCLSSSVLTALREAVKAYREEEQNISGWFNWNSPATCEKIRTCCEDRFEIGRAHV